LKPVASIQKSASSVEVFSRITDSILPFSEFKLISLTSASITFILLWKQIFSKKALSFIVSK
jgi:hypothetical protein